jgi:penicillin-binding protein 1C
MALRQPGSTLKPFTYALAFEDGLSPATVLADVPSHFPTAQPGVVYSPRNYDGRFRGPLLARRALAGSENVPAVALASRVGVPALQRFLGRAGFSTFDKTASYYGLGLTLGNAEVRLDEMVAAYAAFARGGVWMPSTYLAADRDPVVRRLVSPRTAFWITDILSDNDAREYIFGRGGSLEFPFPVAVKTGTSQAYHDNWTIGYTAHVTVGVWVGNFDRMPLRNSSGVSGAGPIFHAVMLAAETRVGKSDGDQRELATPPGDVHEREICALSGMAAQTWCPTRQREWVALGQEPDGCNWHQQSADGMEVNWPAEYRDWLEARSGGPSGPPRAGLKPRHYAHNSRVEGFRISSPPDGSTYLIDPTLRREFQTLPLRAIATAPGEIEWTINGEPVGSGDANTSIAWPLRAGQHRITARDAHGRVAETTVTVR